MSYAMPHAPQSLRRALGAVRACGPHSTYNAADDECYCDVGYMQSGTSLCTPVNVAAPCAANLIRSPVDKRCGCPPGTILNPDPAANDCIPGSWYPDCVDAQGKSVPNCLFGLPATRAVPILVGGVLVGALLGALGRSLLR